MFCVKCGEKLPENTKFCIKCGANLSAESSPPSAGSEIPPQVHTQANVPKPNNNKKIGIIAAAVLVPIIAVVAFFALRPGPEAEIPNIPAYTAQAEPSPTPEPQPTPEPVADVDEWVTLGSEDIGYLFQIPSAWSYNFNPTRENYWQGSGFDIRTHNPVVSVATYLNTIHGPTIHDLFGYEMPWARHAAVSDFEFDDGRMGFRATNLRGGTITFATLNEATLEMAILRVYLWEDDIWADIPWDADIPDDSTIEWAELHWDLQWNDMYWWDGLDWFNENEGLLDRVGRSLTPNKTSQGTVAVTQDGNLDERLFGAWELHEEGLPDWLTLTRGFNSDGSGFFWGDGPGQEFTWRADGNTLTMDVRCEAFEDEWTEVFRYEIAGDTMTFTHADGWQRVYARESSASATQPEHDISPANVAFVGRWENAQGTRWVELNHDGTAATNFSPWNVSLYNNARDNITWTVENGDVVLTIQRTIAGEFSFDENGRLFFPDGLGGIISSNLNFVRRGERSGLLGVWMPTTGQHGMQFYADGTGISGWWGLLGGGEPFAWSENNGYLTKFFASTTILTYTTNAGPDGSTLTTHTHHGSVPLTKVW